LCCAVVEKRPRVFVFPYGLFSTIQGHTREASGTKNKTMHPEKGNVQTDGPPPESICTAIEGS